MRSNTLSGYYEPGDFKFGSSVIHNINYEESFISSCHNQSSIIQSGSRVLNARQTLTERNSLQLFSTTDRVVSDANTHLSRVSRSISAFQLNNTLLLSVINKQTSKPNKITHLPSAIQVNFEDSTQLTIPTLPIKFAANPPYFLEIQNVTNTLSTSTAALLFPCD